MYKLIKRGMKNYKNILRSKRGVTLVQIFFVLVIIIGLVVFLNPIDMIQKTSRGRATSAWSTDLSNLSNDILTHSKRQDMMYSITIQNAVPYYNITVTPPAVSAYDPMQKLYIEGTPGSSTNYRTLTFDQNSFVTYGENGGVTLLGSTYKLFNYRNEEIKEGSAGPSVATTLHGLAQGGSNGIAPFINLAIPKVEEHLFLGMLGGLGTELGKDYMKENTFTRLGGHTLRDFLNMVFGEGSEKTLYDSEPDRWITLNLIDTQAAKAILGVNSRFLDPDKYRIYWVSSVVTEAQALQIAKKKLTSVASDIETTRPYTTQVTRDLVELYEAMINNVSSDTIVVMPLDRNDVVYSSESDFKYYRFTSAD